MISSVDIARILRTLEHAAFDPREWQSALNQLSESFQSTLFALRTFASERPAYVVSHSGAQAAEAYFNGEWSGLDLRAHRFKNAPQMQFVEDFDLVSAEEFQRADFYRGFADEFGLTHLLAWRLEIGGESIAIASNRSRDRGPMGLDERSVLQQILTPASTAAIVSAHITNARTSAFLEALAGSGAAAIILGAKGKVLAVTPAAESLFTPEFSVLGGQLQISGHTPHEALQGLYEATDADRSTGARLKSFAIRTSAGRRIVCLPLLLQGPGRDVFSSARAIIILRWVDRPVSTDRTILSELFKLTPSEAAVVGLLAEGNSANEIAAIREVSIETIRAMLKAAFAKTGTRSQAELVALVLRATTGIAN